MATFAIHSHRWYLFLGSAILLCVGIWYWSQSTQVSVNYPLIIETEVVNIVNVLTVLDVSNIQNLSAGEATILRAQLITHADVIVDTVKLAEKSELQPFQRHEIVVSLEVLSQTLEQNDAKLQALDIQTGLSPDNEPTWQPIKQHLMSAINSLEQFINE